MLRRLNFILIFYTYRCVGSYADNNPKKPIDLIGKGADGLQGIVTQLKNDIVAYALLRVVSEYDYSRFFKWLLFKACDSSCISHSQLKGKELRSRKKDVDDRIFKVKQTHNNNLWNAINGYPGANSGGRGRGVDGMVNSW